MSKLILLALSLLPTLSFAVNEVRPSEYDPRIVYVTYNVSDVVQIPVKRGTITRIVFDAGETIVRSASGFPADCSVSGLEWCISASMGDDQAWLKPLAGATHNNVEISTNLRHYSFKLNVLDDKSVGKEVFRVIFQYPSKPVIMPSGLLRTVQMPQAIVPAQAKTVQSNLPAIRNAKYSLDASLSGAEITPSLIFDDGVFTYFRFKDNSTIPSIFAVGVDGEETVNFSMEGGGEQVGDLLRVHRLAKHFILRNGSAVVGVWNDNYDAAGVGVTNGSTDSNLRRVLK